MLRFRGSRYFRQRLVCSTLSGRAIRIDDIRALDERPGLREFEASLLRLLEKITNGCTIEINETGTSLRYKPGFIVGGTITHDCGTARSIGYFLEALVCLAPFGKKALAATLRGITNAEEDLSVDLIRTVTLPNLKHFGIDEENLELKIAKRGAPPEGGGEVIFKCPVVKQLRPIQLLDEGKIKRIRGVAYVTRMSPQAANRMVDSARALLNKFIPDVYIYTDHYKGNDSGRSPGFALSLVAESTTGTLLCAEKVGEAGSMPEDIGTAAARLLMEEIMKGGCVDTSAQGTMLLLMALGPEDVSKIRLGKLSPYTVELLRHIRQFFSVTFKVKVDPESDTLLASCLGAGFTNMSRRVM
eukprot:tig00000989_g6112.t1